MTNNDTASARQEDDILWGAAEIGAVINRKPRQAFRLLEAGLLPAKKFGKQWVSMRGELKRACFPNR